jgi:hypothetical protein
VPRLCSVVESSVCSAGLLSLLRAAEEAVLMILNKCVDAVVIQVCGAGEAYDCEGLTVLDNLSASWQCRRTSASFSFLLFLLKKSPGLEKTD